MKSSVVLSDDWLTESVPFHIAVNQRGLIVQHGKMLGRFLGADSIGTYILDHFEIHRPLNDAVPNAEGKEDWLRIASTKNIWVINHLTSALKIKGAWQTHGDHALFIGNLWVFNIEELNTLGLPLIELPLHDQTPDYLIVLQQQATSMKEMQELNDRLAETRDQATAASRAKTAFLASMSHEIRTPLNGVIGIGEALEQTTLDEHQQELLGTMRSSSKHLMQIINDILDFSKVEAGELKLTPSPVHFRNMLNDVLAIFEPISAQKQILIKHQTCADLPEWLELDGTRIKQVLMNLLSNAIKFSPPEQDVHIDVNYSKPRINISVKDSGPGISSEEQADIFMPFKQSEEGTKRGSSGTGLGLPICKYIVELLKGSIELESDINQGARFTVAFDVVPCAPSAEEKNESQAQYQGRALIVDDNSVNRTVAMHLLRRTGLETATAEDGEIALALFADPNENFDIIFMDCHMPVMDGYDATIEIRNLDQQIPIIALTADVFDETNKACLKAGMNAVLTKPISRPAMFRILDQYLQKQAST